ncbi:unnamed protein product [Penicillium olsonii]|nr:unnamed protein product [Penicillium olsonii]CAG7925819.1 unnamed protein product [Penicillium olsonii]
MPATAGFTEVIPALEFTLGPNEGGPFRLGYLQMIIWSLGLSFFGILFAALLKDRLIFPTVWPWPGATASANVINALYTKEKTVLEVPITPDTEPTVTTGLLSDTTREECEEAGPEPEKLPRDLSLILTSAAWSALFTVFMFFVPITKDLPLFGRQAARKWLWTFSLSPDFFGSGMIMGPEIVLHMLMGAVVGWGILSPYVKFKGWAPGDVNDWETGSRDWLIWISLACLMADTLVKMIWIYFKVIWEKYGHLFPWTWDDGLALFRPQRIMLPDQPHGYVPATTNHDVDGEDAAEDVADEPSYSTSLASLDGRRKSSYGGCVLSAGFIASILACVLATHLVFGNEMPWYYTVVSILLALPVAMTGIRGLAESDFNAGSGLAAQLFLAAITPRSNPNSVMINILSAAIANGGANQSGDLAFDLKIGQLVGAPPEVQTYGQIIGSFFGALVSCLTYRLFTNQFPVPGDFIQVPNSFLQVSTAKMVLNKGLPPGAGGYALGFGIFFAIATVIKMRFQDKW